MQASSSREALSTRVLELERQLRMATPVPPAPIQELSEENETKEGEESGGGGASSPSLASQPTIGAGRQPIERLSHELESKIISFLSDLSLGQLHCVSCSWHEAANRADSSKKPAQDRKTNEMRDYFARLDDVDLFG
jgi:hypothetical protein